MSLKNKAVIPKSRPVHQMFGMTSAPGGALASMFVSDSIIQGVVEHVSEVSDCEEGISVHHLEPANTAEKIFHPPNTSLHLKSFLLNISMIYFIYFIYQPVATFCDIPYIPISTNISSLLEGDLSSPG